MTILPYMEDLTDKQEFNFKAITEITEEVYTSVFFKSNEEKQASDVRKFGAKYGFEVTRVGLFNEEETNKFFFLFRF